MRSALRAVAVLVALVTLLVGCGGQVLPPALPSLSSPVVAPPTVAGAPPVEGPLRSVGGPFLTDSTGRVVFLHGVNAVYKLAPYELYPAPGKPWNFTAADASLMARLGFDVVRLGMTWKGLEPGTAPANDPAICDTGPPHDPGQFDQAVLDRYLAKLARTVDLLGRFHIYTLLDMHQDVYSELFGGEGAPNWAVCTNGVPETKPPGRWSQGYSTTAAGIAYDHFWENDVVGDLQGEYDRVWAAVATYFRSNPWVVGYDPFNEPFSTALVLQGGEAFDSELVCFYTGTAHVGETANGAPPITCPPGDPALGVIPTIEAADPVHLVFYEPDIYADRGYPNFVGPMDFPDLVFNVHAYCSQRNGHTGNPTQLTACAAAEQRALTSRAEDRTELSSPVQPGSPAWFVSEFGATSSSALLTQLTYVEDGLLVGWTYWAWKYYDDPTGSADEALVRANGGLRATAKVLARTYPEAVAGTPQAMSFDPATGAFDLRYTPDPAVDAPTVIFVPTQIHYPNGYCAVVSGARITSRPDSELLSVVNLPSSTAVRVSVSAGHCPEAG